MPGDGDERRDIVQPATSRRPRKRRAVASPHVFLHMLPDLPDAARAPEPAPAPKPAAGVRAPRGRAIDTRPAAPSQSDPSPAAREEPANLFEAVSLAQVHFCARGLLAWSRVCVATLGKS